MQIENIKTDTLIPYARNSRTHSAEQVAQIAGSIREFGWTNPVLIDEAGTIIAGHGRLMAARKLGMAEVPCIRLSGLSEAQKRAYVIADNKLALNAGWDEEMLATELRALQEANYDVSGLGFSAEELAKALGEDGSGESSDGGTEEVGERWEIAVECAGEQQQLALLKRFQEEGLTCRALTF